MKQYLEILRKTKLFARISDDDMLAALQCLKPRVKSYQKGTVIFSEGAKAGYIGVVLNGEVQSQKIDFFGNVNIISKLYAADLIAAAAIFSSTKTIPFDFVCVADSEVLILDNTALIKQCCNACSFHSQIIANMLGIIADKTIQLITKMDILLKRTTREKILAFLYAQPKKSENAKFSITMSRHQMANYLSVDRSALSRELCNMRNEGIIDFDNNIFQLKD